MGKNTALDLTLALIPSVRVLVSKIRPTDRHLADQLRRAVTSIALNLAEADGNRHGNRRIRLLTAHGSANEAKVALSPSTSRRATSRRSSRSSTAGAR